MISPVNTSCLHHAYLINDLPFLGTEFSASSSWSSSVTCSFLGWINPSLWSDNKTAQISTRRLNGLPDIRDHNLGQSWWNTARYKRCHHGARGTGKWIHVCSASFSKSVFTICLLRMMAIWASTDDETRNELSLLLLLFHLTDFQTWTLMCESVNPGLTPPVQGLVLIHWVLWYLLFLQYIELHWSKDCTHL